MYLKVKETTFSVCLTLCNPMDYSLPGSSVHGILQARILEWVAIPFSKRPFWPGIEHAGSPAFHRFLYHLNYERSNTNSIQITKILTTTEKLCHKWRNLLVIRRKLESLLCKIVCFVSFTPWLRRLLILSSVWG